MKNKDQINFNYNEYLTRHLSLECKEYMGRLARGEDAEKVASSLYEEKLGYSKEQAEDAVGSIKGDLDFYHDSMQKATENKEEWIRSSLINRVDMLDSAAERSEYYFRIIVALDAYNIKNSGDEDADAKAAEYVEKRISNVPDEKELAEMENELLCEAVNKYMTTDFLTREIEDVLNTVEDASDEDLPLVALRYGRESEGVKLILSAQACIDALQGKFSDVNKYTSQRVIVTNISAMVDIDSVAADAAKGNVNVTFLEVVMGIVSLVCVALWLGELAKFIFTSSAPVFVSLLGFSPMLALCLCAIVAIGASFYIFSKIKDDMWEVPSSIGKWADDGISKVFTAIRNANDNRKKAKTPLPETDLDTPRVFVNTDSKKASRLPEDQRPDENRDINLTSTLKNKEKTKA